MINKTTQLKAPFVPMFVEDVPMFVENVPMFVERLKKSLLTARVYEAFFRYIYLHIIQNVNIGRPRPAFGVRGLSPIKNKTLKPKPSFYKRGFLGLIKAISPAFYAR